VGLTGGEFIAEYLIKEKVPYVFGIPGHGDMALFDAFKDRQDRIEIIGVKHEQAAAHMADAYFRACGRPLATLTSIGPGSLNVATGLATAFVDSIPLISFTGGPQTYMLGKGVLQELERQQDNVFPHIMQPMVKRNWDVQHVDLMADVLPRAFNNMLSGRPGPIHVEVPMDVQANVTEAAVPDPASRRAAWGRVKPDPDGVDAAAKRLLSARRPVILAGGGVLTAEAAAELRAVAEYLDAPVVTTMMGKGAFPEDHPLAAEHTGANGTAVGNHMTRNADVLLAVGTRFAEQNSSSYVDGMSYSIPPTELIHFDIDPTEIGKNYPTAVGVVCDAKAGLADLLDALQDRNGAATIDRPEYRAEVAEMRRQWLEAMTGRWTEKLSLSRVLHGAREALPRLLDGIYEEPEKSIIMAEVLHAIIGHRRRGQPYTVEAGIVRVADALDMAEGRTRVPLEAGQEGIHSISAAAIDRVNIAAGENRPIRLEIELNNSAGIFQVDDLLATKIRDTPLAEHIEVVAEVQGESEKRLLSGFRLG